MTLSLLHGNALALPLADRSVHLVCTSPPYFALRSYRDGDEHFDGQLGSEATPLHFLAALWAVMDECWRVLRDDGSCWVNLGDKFSGSGGNNNAGVGGSKRGPSSYNKATGGLLPKSRMMLPHLFAEGCQYLWLRRAVEVEAGLTPTATPPQWICRMDAVWSKPNGLPESVTDRVRASHENWFHLVKSERYFAAMDEVREEYAPGSLDKYAGGGLVSSVGDATHPSKVQGGKQRRDGDEESWRGNPLGKLPGSVWTVATEPLTLPPHLPQHFAAFPSYFPRRIIAGWSPSGVCTACGEGRRPVCEKEHRVLAPIVLTERAHLPGQGNTFATRALGRASVEASIVGYACACPAPTAPTTPARVLDPFSGTGTTSIVADALGRHGIGVDLSWDYHRIARWRFGDGGLRAKALGVEKPAKELEGQLSLLGEAG